MMRIYAQKLLRLDTNKVKNMLVSNKTMRTQYKGLFFSAILFQENVTYYIHILKQDMLCSTFLKKISGDRMKKVQKKLGPSKELMSLLNKALEMEHQAYIQYLSHAELVDGLISEPIEARLKEIAEDEEKHQKMLRNVIGKFFGGTPSIKMTEAHPAQSIVEILKANLKDEIEAVDMYSKLLQKLQEEKENLPYQYLKVEHEVRHILMDEQEHIAELKQLLEIK